MGSRPENLIYAVDDKPPFLTLMALGLQQVCVISIYLILTTVIAKAAHASPEIMQSMVSWSMIALAIGTVLQALMKGPIGSGYLAPPVISAMYLQPSLLAVEAGGLPLVFGLTMTAGFFEILISRIFKSIYSFFPPVVCGLILIAVGFELGIIGTEQFLDAKDVNPQDYVKHIAIGMITLCMILGLTIWGKGGIRLISSLIGISIGWIISFTFGMVSENDLQSFLKSPWIGFPNNNYFAYSWDIKLIVPFLIAAIAAAVRVIGILTTCQKINDVNWRRPDKVNIQKGILADGVGCFLGGLLGVSGISSSPSAVGVSQFTLATSRYIAYAIAAWFIVLSCIPKIIALFITIPTAVVGSALLYTGSIMLVGGIQIITSQAIDVRKTFIIGISIFFGLSHRVFPEYYSHLPVWLQMFTSTILSITAVVALVLNAIFRIGSKQSKQMIVETQQDIKKIEEIIRTHAKKWGGKTEIVESAIEFLNVICAEVFENSYCQGPIHASISYDDIHLKVQVSYQGKLFTINDKTFVSLDSMIDEMPMSLGLSSYLEPIYPDKVSSKYHEGQCQIQFSFELF
jgi:xanthine permease XanP